MPPTELLAEQPAGQRVKRGQAAFVGLGRLLDPAALLDLGLLVRGVTDHLPGDRNPTPTGCPHAQPLSPIDHYHFTPCPGNVFITRIDRGELEFKLTRRRFTDGWTVTPAISITVQLVSCSVRQVLVKTT
jgi:hypothetical protein